MLFYISRTFLASQVQNQNSDQVQWIKQKVKPTANLKLYGANVMHLQSPDIKPIFFSDLTEPFLFN